MQYLPGTKILCLEVSEFCPHILSEENLRQAKTRGTVIVHGVGGNGRNRLIEFESLAAKYKKAVIDRYGDPYEYHSQQPILALLKQDIAARNFYSTHLLPDGRNLPIEYQTMYARQCDWFNMINIVLADTKAVKEQLGISITQFWDTVIPLAQKDEIENGLPSSYKRFTSRLRLYNADGYPGLISSNFGNQKTRKVSTDIERLLIALYMMPERPYYKVVCDYYKQFIAGEIEVIDMETGEVFEPKDFYVNGEPYVVTESTVRYYIDSKPINRATVDKKRMSNLQYVTKHRPFHMREAPSFVFSKITMDDITIPFKMANGKRVWSYQVFDVASQAVIGVSFNKDKSQELVRDSLRDMLLRIARNGWGMPMEVEVEQHLNSGMKGGVDEDGVFEADIMTEGAMFPFVRFCAARNPQEKRAEGFIRLKKYGFQKNRTGFQFRPFAKNEANRANEDAKDVFYSYDEIVAHEKSDIAAYNNALHSDQDKYPGLSRWDVLLKNQNPAYAPANLATILPYIGQRVRTSINRGYVSINYKKYRLADIGILATLTSDKVIAYCLNDENGQTMYAHLYDGGENPVCEAVEVERFQEAKAEQTPEDMKILGKQKAYINKFDGMVKEKAATIVPIAVIPKDKAEAIRTIPAPVHVAEPTPDEREYNNDNGNDALWFMNPDEVARRARRDI